jgi:hypothetical protein
VDPETVASARRRVRRRWTVAALVLLLLVALAIDQRAQAVAQWRALVVLSVSLQTPVVTRVADDLTAAPVIQNRRVAGVPTTVALPPGGGRHPAVIFFNGATADGRFNPHVISLTDGLGRAGFITVVPDLPGLRSATLTPRALAAAAAVVRTVASRADVSRTGILGVSVGCSMALVIAEQPALRQQLSAIAGLAPYTDLRAVMMMALTDAYPLPGGRLYHFGPNPFVGLVAARSLAAGLPPSRGRRVLLSRFLAIDDNARRPLAGLDQIPTGDLGAPERSLLRLLENRDPRRFDALYRELPAHVRAGVEQLSPLPHAVALDLPVELASSPHDSYFPLVQYPPLLAAAPRVHLTVTAALAHAVPHASLSDIEGTARLDGFAVSALRDFAPPVGVDWLALAIVAVALSLVAAEGFTGHHGVVGALGIAALLATLPALPHADGWRTPLDVAVAAEAVAIAVILAGRRQHAARPVGRRPA